MDLDRVPEASQVITGGKSARPRPDDQDALARRRRGLRKGPAFANGHVAEKTLDRMNGNGAIELLAVAIRFARMVADAPVHGRQRVVLDEDLPSRVMPAGARFGQPTLDVLAGGARMIARR